MRVAMSLRRLLSHKLVQPGGRAARVAAIAVVVLAAIASLTPHISVPSSAPAHTDLGIHLILQGALGFALIWGWPKNRVAVLGVLTVLVVALEVGQIWIPGRSFASADLFSNALGAGLGFGAGWWLLYSYAELFPGPKSPVRASDQ